MDNKVRRFVKARLASESKPSATAKSLGDIETMFVEKLMEKCKLVERDILRVFKRFDKDGSGFLSTDELTSAIHLYLNGVDRNRVVELVSHYDVDHDGNISLEEFTSFLISRSSQDKSSWQTVDTLIEKKVKQNKSQSIHESNFARENQNVENYNDQSFDSASAIEHPTPQQSTSHKASVFLQNTKALLLKRAQEVRQAGLISVEERLSKHAAPLAESIARSILSKSFQPYMSAGTRVEVSAFARVLTKFTYPGSPPPRQEVVSFLFNLCRNGQERADPDLLVDMIFDKGGERTNKWGFAQHVAAATDTGRPAVGKGPFVRHEGDIPAKVTDVPYRINMPQSRTALAAPSDFDPSLIHRSAQIPACTVARDFVYGINLNIYSGEPVVYLPESRQEVLYSAASLMVIHDLSNGTQAYFDGHTDDISCFSVSNDGSLVASGQIGKSPCVLVWETALQAEVHTAGPQSNAPDTPTGLVARIGRGWFQSGVCATSFSCDNKYVAAIGCDDKHNMGVWAVCNGELLANIPTAPGIPPQIRSLKWSPGSFQDTAFISAEHEQSQCDMIVTCGEHNFLRFWSFKRPNKNGVGASLSGRGHSTPKSVGTAPPDTHRCIVFVPRQDDQDPVAPQYNVITAGNTGYVYLWQESSCIRVSQALADGMSISSMVLQSGSGNADILVVGGQGGVVAILDPITLDVFTTMSAFGNAPRAGSGPPTLAQIKSFSVPAAVVRGKDISVRTASAPLRRPSSAVESTSRVRNPEANQSMAGRPTGTGRPATAGPSNSRSGIFRQDAVQERPVKKPQAKDPLKAKKAWKGPALLQEEKPLPGGVKSSSDILGLTIVCHRMSDDAVEKYILCATGVGRLVRLPLPNPSNRREIEAAAIAQPVTLSYFHYGPLYGIGVCPPKMTMAPTSTLFASGGDDCWMCLWNADTKALVVRTRTRAPVRALSVDATGVLFAVGLAGGAFTVYACDVSNIAAKTLRNQGKTAAAFQRTTDCLFETAFVEHVHRRDCKEDISDLKFSPNGRLLAVASHDGFIDVYSAKFTRGNLQTPHSDVMIKHLKRLRGHSASVLHVDWSMDNRLLQSSCAAHELLYWDVAEGRQLLSSQDCVEGDTVWATESCHLGFGVMGIWGGGNQKASDINSVDVSRGLGLVATGDDKGRLQIFNYPCVVKDAPHLTMRGHSSHVLTTKWLESAGRGLLATAGGSDDSAIVWRIKRSK